MNKKIKHQLILSFIIHLKFVLLAIFFVLIAKDFSNSVCFIGHHTSVYDLCDYENIGNSTASNNYFITITDYFNQEKLSEFNLGAKKNRNSKDSEKLTDYSVEIPNSDINKYLKYFKKIFGLSPFTDNSLLNKIVNSQKENESFNINFLPPAFIDKLRL